MIPLISFSAFSVSFLLCENLYAAFYRCFCHLFLCSAQFPLTAFLIIGLLFCFISLIYVSYFVYPVDLKVLCFPSCEDQGSNLVVSPHIRRFVHHFRAEVSPLEIAIFSCHSF